MFQAIRAVRVGMEWTVSERLSSELLICTYVCDLLASIQSLCIALVYNCIAIVYSNCIYTILLSMRIFVHICSKYCTNGTGIFRTRGPGTRSGNVPNGLDPCSWQVSPWLGLCMLLSIIPTGKI